MSSKTVKKKALPKGWREVRLGEVGVIHSGGTPSTRDDSNWNGSIFWLTPSEVTKLDQKHISSTERKITQKGLSDTTMLPEGCLIVCTRATIGDCCINTVPMAINQGFKCIQPHEAYSTTFLYYILKSLKQQLVRLSCGNTFGEVSRKDFSNILIAVPSLSEQKAIAALLETWDTAIEKTEALIAAKEKRFKWLLKTLICDERHKRDFVSSFATEISDRNRNGTVGRVLSVTNYNGFVLPEEQFERRVASANLSNYKIVANGQYGYNPSRINVGSIARLDDWDIGVLSPMYVVFSLDEEKINSDYFSHWLSSEEAKQRIKNSAQGSVRETVSFNDFCLISIPVPPMEKQQRITKILNALKSEISLLSCLAEKYRVQKRGLMQKLLTGKWRVRNVW